MHSDPMGAGSDATLRRVDDARYPETPGVPKQCDLVQVDAEASQCRSSAISLASATRSCSLTRSTIAYQRSFTVVGYMAPRIPPAMDATESLSPPMFAANRAASSADSIRVASPSANGTIVKG